MNTELEEDQNNNEQTSPTVNRHANQSNTSGLGMQI